MAMKTGDAIDTYIKLREKKEGIVRRHKDELAELNENMQLVEGWLMKKFLADDITQSAGKAGTAFIQQNDSCTVQDKQSFVDFVKSNDAFELMDVRASKTVVRAFIENSGNTPPGLKFTQSQKVCIRRKT